MSDIPSQAELLAEAERLVSVLNQSGGLHATDQKGTDDELPEVYYSYGGKDYCLIVTPL